MDLLTAPEDRFRGVSLQDYLPRAPTAGKLRSTALLHRSWRSSPEAEVLNRLVDSAVIECGAGETVWRVRTDSDRDVTWEFYFWAHASRPPADALIAVLDRAGIELDDRIDLALVERTAPLCVSFDWPPAPGAQISVLSLYVPLLPSTAAYYGLGGDGLTFHGTQSRYEWPAESERFRTDVGSSLHLIGADFDEVVPEELRRCRWIYLTHKPRCDGIYCAGLDLAAFEWFLDRAGFPEHLRSFVHGERRRLDHLTFDVGYNVVGGASVVRWGAAGFYGSL